METSDRVADAKIAGTRAVEMSLTEQRDYWMEKLSGQIGYSNLRPDYSRPKEYAYSRGAAPVEIAGELYRKLKELTSDSPFLLYTTLMAALKVCLYKYTGNSFITVGSPARRRENSEENANALAILDKVDDRLTFRQFLIRVRESLLEAYSNQDYPFEDMADLLSPGSSENRCPLFDIALALTDIHCRMPEVKNDITIVFKKEPDRISGEAIFNETLFKSETVESFVSHYLNLMASALEDAPVLISELQLLDGAQRNRLIIELTGAKDYHPRAACLHELFEEQVEKDPYAVALEYEDEQVSYSALNEQANQVAHYLRSLGVDREVIVGLYIERSVKMVVGLLAILKAGGAYLPVDVSIPDERLSFILEDAGVTILLTGGKAAERVAGNQVRVVRLDSDWPDIAQQSTENLCVELSIENLAYVNYTSGTVGLPKGSEIPHRAIPGFIAWKEGLKLDQTQTFLQYSSLSWDALTLELWPALTGGARCALYSHAIVTPERLGEAINRHGVTIVWITSSLLNSILDSTPEILSGVKQLLTGGEALSVSHIRRAQELLPNVEIINGYGPSECTVFCCSYPLTEPIGDTEGTVPIGRPIGDRKVYLLDRNLNLAPPGVTGELYIGGSAVARGYLKRQELTAERFIPDPFAGEPGVRLYKTGDLARYLADGRLEFVGRVDDQIKLHGYRIELGEIEACLVSHAQVQKAAVLVREDAPGDRRLVAYVVGKQGEVSVLELRTYLKSRLPDFMMPSAIVVLDHLPLTKTGKLDRRALPSPVRPRPSAIGDFEAPRTVTEDRLAAVWSDLLGYAPVGVFDNFFEFGGNSIRAFQLFSKIRDLFEIDLPLKHLFDSPTVAGLSLIIERSVKADRLPKLARADRERDLSASFAQQRLWFLDQLQPESPFYNIPGLVRVEGELDIGALEKSFSEIVRRHEGLRTAFRMKDGRILQEIRPAEPVMLPFWDLSQLPETEREAEAQRVVTGEVLRPFDLESGPMLRTGLLRLGPTDHVVLFIMHHIISDGWSMGIFRREMAALYEAFSQGMPSPLPELPIQYADYGVWQQDVLQGEALESSLSYWRERLDGAPSLLELPADHARPPVQSFRGAAHPVILDKELTAEIKQMAWREGVTLFMALLAAFQALLHRYSGSEDISIGTPVAGRNHAEIEGVIGLFVNTLVLRTKLDGNPSFKELLQRMRETALGAFAHQDLPFEKLVEELQPERSLSYTPLFQVMFGFEDGSQDAAPLPGLTLKPVKAERGTSKFDLMLLLEETPQGLVGSLEYNTDLFEVETISRMVRHFRSLIESAVGDPGRKLSELSLLTQEERQLLFLEWNDNSSSYPRDVCLHEIFERQVRDTPDAIALVFGEERLTYRQLDIRANRLANHLKKLGVG
ncbi:MAG: amino acid adenylation domain-containing protein, partial [Blastocatellia bacterium]|nr:amino acid adenylation domain-containing protein [Blastocatellia bacterium]